MERARTAPTCATRNGNYASDTGEHQRYKPDSNPAVASSARDDEMLRDALAKRSIYNTNRAGTSVASRLRSRGGGGGGAGGSAGRMGRYGTERVSQFDTRRWRVVEDSADTMSASAMNRSMASSRLNGEYVPRSERRPGTGGSVRAGSSGSRAAGGTVCGAGAHPSHLQRPIKPFKCSSGGRRSRASASEELNFGGSGGLHASSLEFIPDLRISVDETRSSGSGDNDGSSDREECGEDGGQLDLHARECIAREELHDWIRLYREECDSFASTILHMEMRLDETQRLTKGYGYPNAVRSIVVCELLDALCEQLPRYRTVLPRIVRDVKAAIFVSNGDIIAERLLHNVDDKYGGDVARTRSVRTRRTHDEHREGPAFDDDYYNNDDDDDGDSREDVFDVDSQDEIDAIDEDFACASEDQLVPYFSVFQRVTKEIKRQRELALMSKREVEAQFAISKNVKNGWLRNILLRQMDSSKLAWMTWRAHLLQRSRARGLAEARAERLSLLELNKRWNQWKAKVAEADRLKVRVRRLWVSPLVFNITNGSTADAPRRALAIGSGFETGVLSSLLVRLTARPTHAMALAHLSLLLTAPGACTCPDRSRIVFAALRTRRRLCKTASSSWSRS